jgi:hypothetical protein
VCVCVTFHHGHILRSSTLVGWSTGSRPSTASGRCWKRGMRRRNKGEEKGRGKQRNVEYMIMMRLADVSTEKIKH